MPDATIEKDTTGSGYVEEDGLRREIKERYKYADAHYKEWNDKAKEDYNFALGSQWTEEDQQTLKDAGRPCLTFNRIRPLINLISGYQRENSARIKVNPEGGEDRIFSEVMDRIIKAIDKWSHLSDKLGYLFDDGLYCGKGFLEAIITYDKDPVRGELNFKQCSPYAIKVDPDCLEYDLNDANFLFKTVRLSREKLIELYPKKKRLIEGFVSDSDDEIENSMGLLKEGSDDDYENRPNITTIGKKQAFTEDESGITKDDKFTVKEYWRKKSVKKYFVIEMDSGEPRRFDSKDDAETFTLSQGFGKAIERYVPEMWVSVMVCGHILMDEISSFEPYYSGYPFFRFMADWAPNAEDEELRVQGITRPLVDVQREKNKAKSQTLHILNTQANSGWIGDEDALSEEGKKKLEKMGSKPGITIWKRKGAELREILPKGPNVGHIQREEKADDEFKQISGINPDLMGMQENTASGRAISLRIKQAILSLVRLFSNYKYTKECIGKFILSMVPSLFDEKKMVKVLGTDYMAKAVDPMKYPGGLSEGHIKAFLMMISDMKYDVYVTEGDQNATIRYEIFQDLTELLKAGAPIPIELLIDYMDLPNSEEVKQKIAEQQAQQQQMAMQQAAMKSAPKPTAPRAAKGG